MIHTSRWVLDTNRNAHGIDTSRFELADRVLCEPGRPVLCKFCIDGVRVGLGERAIEAGTRSDVGDDMHDMGTTRNSDPMHCEQSLHFSPPIAAHSRGRVRQLC